MSFNMSNPILFLDRLHKTSPNPPKYSTILLWPLTKDVLRNNYWRNETSTCHRQPKNGNNTEQLVNNWVIGFKYYKWTINMTNQKEGRSTLNP